MGHEPTHRPERLRVSITARGLHTAEAAEKIDLLLFNYWQGTAYRGSSPKLHNCRRGDEESERGNLATSEWKETLQQEQSSTPTETSVSGAAIQRLVSVGVDGHPFNRDPFNRDGMAVKPGLRPLLTSSSL